MAPRLVLALPFGLAAAWMAWVYPLGVLYPLIGLSAYAGLLWWWPRLWLLAVPALLPSLDLAPWTGWLYGAESDLVILVTIAVLLLRAPPRSVDFAMGRLAGIAIGLLTLATAMGCLLGVLTGDHGSASSNPYLQPENALRLGKSLAEALLLLPFLCRSVREGGAPLFAWGMIGGLVLVALASLVERAVFIAPFDFTSGYRIVATFASMHVGGGHIGAYVAMTLPFIAICAVPWRWWSLPILVLLGAIGFYTLTVTFARTAYAAAMVGAVVLGLSWLVAAGARPNAGGGWRWLSILLAIVAVGGVALAATRSDFMRERLALVVPDLAVREANWFDGVALRDKDVGTALFGMGIGTYPRLLAERSSRAMHATSFLVQGDEGQRYLSLGRSSPLYFGQRVRLVPGQSYRVSLKARGSEPAAALSVSVCEKMLLYSDNCRGLTLKPAQPGAWQQFTADISAAGLGEHAVLGVLNRPVEFAVHSADGTVMDVTDLRLADAQGRNVLENGDFRLGTARWYFTDDDHPSWRILNLYFSTVLETGWLGLGVLLFVMAAGLQGALQAMRRGDPMGAIVAASLSSFIFSGLCDNVLEAPRLAAVFYLVLFLALRLGATPRPASR